VHPVGIDPEQPQALAHPGDPEAAPPIRKPVVTAVRTVKRTSTA
jgi:hypothetical protein